MFACLWMYVGALHSLTILFNYLMKMTHWSVPFDLLQKWGSEQVMNVSCLKEMFNNHFSQIDINFFYWHFSIEHNWILFKSEQSSEKNAILWDHWKYQIGVDNEFGIDLAQIQNLLLSYCNIFCCFCCFCYVL